MDRDLDDQPGSSCDEVESPEACHLPFRRNHSERTGSMEIDGIARVKIENEAAALREALNEHQQSMSNLRNDLELERNASASAADEAMAMILRLEREKAACQMELRQFKCFAEERMAHDQQEIASLEDLLFKRDHAIQSLSCEVQAYKHRLLSYGILDQNPSSFEPDTPRNQLYPSFFEPNTPRNQLNPTSFEPNTPRDQLGSLPPPTPPAPIIEYPPLRCTLSVPQAYDDYEPVIAYNTGETPREHLHRLEQRIGHLEKLPSRVTEKGVLVGQSSSSPRWPRHLMRRKFSSSFNSFGSCSGNFYRREEFPVAVDRPSAFNEDDEMSDRIYTVRVCGGEDSCASTPRDLGMGPTPRKVRTDSGHVFNEPGGGGAEKEEIRKLRMRLQALEADRESMKQTLVSMGSDKAQLVLLREIAQQFCKDSASDKKIIKAAPSFPKARTFSLLSVIKWITSVIFWRKRSARIKYPFGLSSSNAGLLLLLQKSPRLKRRYLSKQRTSC